MSIQQLIVFAVWVCLSNLSFSGVCVVGEGGVIPHPPAQFPLNPSSSFWVNKQPNQSMKEQMDEILSYLPLRDDYRLIADITFHSHFWEERRGEGRVTNGAAALQGRVGISWEMLPYLLIAPFLLRLHKSIQTTFDRMLRVAMANRLYVYAKKHVVMDAVLNEISLSQLPYWSIEGNLFCVSVLFYNWRGPISVCYIGFFNCSYILFCHSINMTL